MAALVSRVGDVDAAYEERPLIWKARILLDTARPAEAEAVLREAPNVRNAILREAEKADLVVMGASAVPGAGVVTAPAVASIISRAWLRTAFSSRS